MKMSQKMSNGTNLTKQVDYDMPGIQIRKFETKPSKLVTHPVKVQVQTSQIHTFKEYDFGFLSKYERPMEGKLATERKQGPQNQLLRSLNFDDEKRDAGGLICEDGNYQTKKTRSILRSPRPLNINITKELMCLMDRKDIRGNQTSRKMESSSVFGAQVKLSSYNAIKKHDNIRREYSINFESSAQDGFDKSSWNSSEDTIDENPLSSRLSLKSSNIFHFDQNRKCTCGKSQNGICQFASSWIKKFNNRNRDLNALNENYEMLRARPRDEIFKDQIWKDVVRTFPHLGIYIENSSDSHKLGEVLNSIAVRYPVIGYVQGMNFLVASIIYHIGEEYLSFWTTSYLIDHLNMQEVYMNGTLSLK